MQCLRQRDVSGTAVRRHAPAPRPAAHIRLAACGQCSQSVCGAEDVRWCVLHRHVTPHQAPIGARLSAVGRRSCPRLASPPSRCIQSRAAARTAAGVRVRRRYSRWHRVSVGRDQRVAVYRTRANARAPPSRAVKVAQRFCRQRTPDRTAACNSPPSHPSTAANALGASPPTRTHACQHTRSTHRRAPG